MTTCHAVELATAVDARGAQYLKLDHLGERIAVSIYAAQAAVCRWTAPQLVPLLAEFLVHERQHERVFATLLQRRGVIPCRGSSVLGVAGWILGAATAALGTAGVMACTAGVETVVLEHLVRQLDYLRTSDAQAVAAIESILADELAHRDTGAQGSNHGPLYRVVRWTAGFATARVIAVGMYL